MFGLTNLSPVWLRYNSLAVYGPPRGLKMHSSAGGSYANTCRGFRRCRLRSTQRELVAITGGPGYFPSDTRAWDVNKSQHALGLFMASENSGYRAFGHLYAARTRGRVGVSNLRNYTCACRTGYFSPVLEKTPVQRPQGCRGMFPPTCMPYGRLRA